MRDQELVGDLMEYVSRRYPEVYYRHRQALDRRKTAYILEQVRASRELSQRASGES